MSGSHTAAAGGANVTGEPANAPSGTQSGRLGSQQQTDSGSSEPTNQRFSNLIRDSEIFLTKLREFKPQSLGCLEARRKSSSTLIFPSPQQACMGPPKCPKYPHRVKPTPGYWIECHGPGVYSNAPVSGRATSVSQASAQETSKYDESRKSPISIRSNSSDRNQLSSVGQQNSATTAERIMTRNDKDSEVTNEKSESHIISQSSVVVSATRRRRSLERSDSSSLVDASAKQISNSQMTSQLEDDPLHAEHLIQSPGPDNWVKLLDNLTNQAKPVTRGSKKRLNKRTMTRDDIDLHKSRRGTPDITITEPSLSQSITIASQSSSQRQKRGPARHSSQGFESFERTSNDDRKPISIPAAEDSNSSAQQQQQQQQPQPIKFQIQRYMSIEAQQNKDDQTGTSKTRNFIIERQESSETEESIPSYELPSSAQRSTGAHHRPSIIREDIDNETNAEGPGIVQTSIQEQKEFCCGLSTTAYNKKSYQQAYSQSQNIEQFQDSSLELISFEEENYEKHYYGREHWNYFTNDELLGPVMLSLKQEVNNQRDHFHVLLRTVSYTLHGTIPASTICADRYDREAIVRELSEIAKLKPPLMLGQLPSTPDELLKLDHIFIKTELKVGVIHIKAGQEESEEAILSNKEESPLFTEFLNILGDRITLKGFDRYKGGLDTVHNLTGIESIYTSWRNIEIMFHVSTMLPHEENDPQKLQKKRHIGNDIVCVAFIESDDALFWPGCIKSYFLHTFIAVQTSPKPLKEGEKRKYSVSCVCRNEVQYAFKPYLVEQDEFYKSDYFREWLLVKIVNGERASYSAPKFARMQDRTRSQLLEDIITNLANHLMTGQIPKPYRRGSWRPLGHTRASSPLEDSMKDYFEDYDQLAKDFCNAFCGPNKSVLCDVVFKVRDEDGSYKLVHGVRAILAIRSRTFLEMLYGFVPPGAGASGLQNQTNLRAIEMKALSGQSSSGKEIEQQSKNMLAKRGSVGTDSSKKMGEKERRQSMLPNLSKSTASQKPNYLTVPNTSSGASISGGSSTGGMIKNAFNRLVSGNWSGWGSNIKGFKGEPIHIKVDQNKTKVDLNSLAICKEIAKIDADKLTQREFEIKEFDYETFQQTIEYIHNGQCKLSYDTIPGLICAAEHYDLPDLLHACFHHANTHMRLSAAPKMMNALYQNSCFYITAMQLLDSIYEFIDHNGNEFFSRNEYLELYESVFTSLLSRKTLQISELRKFQAMHGWTRQQVVNRRQNTKQRQRKSSFADHEKLAGSSVEPESTTLSSAATAITPAIQPSELVVETTSTTEHEPATAVEAAITAVNNSASTAFTIANTTATAAAVSDLDLESLLTTEEAETEYKNLMVRLNKEINIKLDKITNEDLVKVVLPTKVFNNDKIFDIMSDESRIDY